MTDHAFPEDFVWGVATSCYQIEGAAQEDGRGESIWDRFAATPGKVIDGSSGAVACDHYHRYVEDVALMKSLNVPAYRFSIAWPRVVPAGRGAVNQKGLDFYSRLVDTLLEAGIKPFATLYHWDLPQVLEDEGGWSKRETAKAFVDYAEAVVRHLGDRVTDWITHNEPWCASMLGYEMGVHAPGVVDKARAIVASHHLLLSHGWAMPVIREHCPGARAGITLNLQPMEPASDSAADHDAWRHSDGHFNRWFLDPVHGRGYPEDMVRDYIAGGFLPAEGMTMVQPGDLEAIAAPADFLGVNYYNRMIIRSEKIPEAQNDPVIRSLAPKEEWTEMGWEVYPNGLYQTLMRVYLHYGPRKMYVTENGCSYSTGPDADGQVPDARRVAYFRDHLRAAHRAIADGAPLAGYFAWSLMDNYEWERGYGQRFGIVHVDYETQARTPKASAEFLAKVFADNAVPVDETPA
ncbi:beta-glucosidase [Plesiocystis pacifica SIR-1]|uniref:Beta-glucosidase n=1 Tax=Plesiocystis pacifica SIR-1 TaxID=391625 RepID=A6GCT8_9BACT|nr:GH1 family beta-glucosidase [Plesiocystis pacifica]EDM76354.1 beta-glucosidase [Plesiocystis pacifica SIR-1]